MIIEIVDIIGEKLDKCNNIKTIGTYSDLTNAFDTFDFKLLL